MARSIQITKDEKHRFQDGNATMVGRLLTLSFGVRQLLIEAGWPRVPRDGVVRGGGLARANIRHFGIKAANESLLLVTSKGVPRWVSLNPPRADQEKSSSLHCEAHLTTLIGK